MSTNSILVNAAVALAGLSPDGTQRLNDLIREKFIVPELEKAKSLDQARAIHDALGDEFGNVFVKLPAPKSRALLKAVGWPAAEATSLSDDEMKVLLRDLLAGKRTLPAKPAAKKPAARKAAAPAALPDVRALYQKGGMPLLYAEIAKLPAPKLKTLIKEQNLTAHEKMGTKKDDLLRYVQVAVKEELGRRGDWIGALSKTTDEG